MLRAGDRPQHRRRVGRGPRYRADVVKRFCQREDAIAADAAPGRLDFGETAGGGRKSDRSSGVAAEAPVAKSQAVATPDPVEEEPTQ